jgi:hypothetical protein
MNFLLPLLVGGPDMAKGSGPFGKNLRTYTINTSSIKSRSNNTSSIVANSNNFASYLAGLFEGDGHI